LNPLPDTPISTRQKKGTARFGTARINFDLELLARIEARTEVFTH
jgi:hypothetical protein